MWGIVITVIWLLVIALIWFFANLKSPVSLNELGDALAGIFAPIAFLWLVLGYVQQGKQLEQNTKALEQQEKALQLQIDEMRETTNQHRQMVSMQTKEFQSTLQSVKPEINFKNCQGDLLDRQIADLKLYHFWIKANILNVGKGDLTDLTILSSKNRTVELIKKIEKNDLIDVQFRINEDEFAMIESCLEAHINCIFFDIFGEQHTQEMRINAVFTTDEFDGEVWETHIIHLD